VGETIRNADGTPYDGRADVRLGAVTVLTGIDRGRYPHGNSVLVQGSEQNLLIDPSVSLGLRSGPAADRVDQIFNSHAHEDHVASNRLFPSAPVYIHEADLPGVQDIDGLLRIYGFDEPAMTAHFRQVLEDEFQFVGSPDAVGVSADTVFDLGGDVRAEVVHLPGHTRGHCGVMVPSAGVCYLGDIDLSGFGPYYGDAWSSLEDFRVTLALCRDIDADFYVTFHHKHVVEGRDRFLAQLTEFTDVIARRDDELLAFLSEPRTLADIVAHRFVYRPTVDEPMVDSIERRSMSQHLDSLLATGRVTCEGEGLWRAG
jgi:glyoxylase-like metal-dependent hydrolase (beta-lactamase superfamily II)